MPTVPLLGWARAPKCLKMMFTTSLNGVCLKTMREVAFTAFTLCGYFRESLKKLPQNPKKHTNLCHFCPSQCFMLPHTLPVMLLIYMLCSLISVSNNKSFNELICCRRSSFTLLGAFLQISVITSNLFAKDPKRLLCRWYNNTNLFAVTSLFMLQ